MDVKLVTLNPSFRPKIYVFVGLSKEGKPYYIVLPAAAPLNSVDPSLPQCPNILPVFGLPGYS